MLTVRSFTVLCLITLAVSVAAALSSRDPGAIPGSGEPLFPGLLSEINDVARIETESIDGRFVLERSEGGWIAPAKSGYPADADKVHKLLVGAAGLTRVEPKTSNPDLYSRLGLDDLDNESSQAVSFRLENAGGEALASLIIGNSAPAKGDPELTEFYVRRPDDSRTWLVEGKLPAGRKLIDWLQRTVAGIDRGRVRDVRVAHTSGETVQVEKDAPSQSEFALKDLPESKTVEGQWKINDIGRLMSSLELEDVLPRDEAPVSGSPDYVVSLRTFDGLAIRMDVFKPDDRAFGVLRAEFEPPAGNAGAEAAQSPLLEPEEVRAEVDRLNAAWKPWAYVLPDYKFNALARKPADFVKDAAKDQAAPQG